MVGPCQTTIFSSGSIDLFWCKHYRDRPGNAWFLDFGHPRFFAPFRADVRTDIPLSHAATRSSPILSSPRQENAGSHLVNKNSTSAESGFSCLRLCFEAQGMFRTRSIHEKSMFTIAVDPRVPISQLAAHTVFGRFEPYMSG